MDEVIENRKRVGAKIRQLRAAQNLSIRMLASMVSADYSHLSKIENGKGDPTLDLLSRIASGLGVDISELFKPLGKTEYVMLKETNDPTS